VVQLAVLTHHLAVVADHRHIHVLGQFRKEHPDLLVHGGDLGVIEPGRPAHGGGQTGRRPVFLVRVVVVDPEEERRLEPGRDGQGGGRGRLGLALGDLGADGVASAQVVVVDAESLVQPVPARQDDGRDHRSGVVAVG
jgi:hypothetical protein